MLLVARRERVGPGAVLVTDLTIRTVDHHLHLIAFGVPAGTADRRTLGRVDGSGPFRMLAADGPSAICRHDMEVALAHEVSQLSLCLWYA